MSAEQADDYMKKAKAKNEAFFFKDRDAAYDLYVKAAGIYKAEKNWRLAGEAFMHAGDTATALKNAGDACSAYTDCAKCLKRVDMNKAKAAMDQAVKLHIESNRLASAARLLKEWGDALEQDEQWDQAIAAFKRAKDFFNAENQEQSSIQCLSRMAFIYANADRFEEAMTTYENVGMKYVEGPLKHQAKDQFFRAFLCRLCTITADNSMEACAQAREALDMYMGLDIYFPKTREAEACEQLLNAVEEGDEEVFNEAVGNLNELRMLDDLKSHLLLKVKEQLTDTR